MSFICTCRASNRKKAQRQAAVGALIGAFAADYQIEQPEDIEVLKRIGRSGSNALENLIAAGAVPPGDILPVGLVMLSALAQLCQSDSVSLLSVVS